jgi:hypothetical protein
MPNYWTNGKPEVVGSTQYKVDGYGFLYSFDCIRYKNGIKIPFLQMTQVFSKYELKLPTVDLYNYFQDLGPKTITSLDRSKQRDEKWAIDNAVKKKKDSEVKNTPKKVNEEDLPSREWISQTLKDKMNEWDEEDQRGNWYNKAKRFVKIITG